MTDEANVDSKAENTQETTQKQQDPAELKQMVDFLTKKVGDLEASNKKWEVDAKKAFDSRNKIKELAKISPDMEELSNSYNLAVKERDDLQAKLKDIELSQQRATKMDLVKQEALKKGIKQSYSAKLDKFVDLDKVDPEHPITITNQVNNLINDFPDFFGNDNKGKALDSAFPRPNPSASGDLSAEDLDKEYNKELNKPAHKQDLKRLLDLKTELLNRTKV